jgi:hypothetical protein
LELQQKELRAQLSRLSATHATVTELHSNLISRDQRIKTAKETQTTLEFRANSLLRKLLTVNQPQISEAEEKWFKELLRVKSKVRSRTGTMAETKLRIAEAKKLVDVATKHGGDSDQVKFADTRVMEAVEEAYVRIVSEANL